ncbi:MAG: hypothetical protein M1816_003347 [Peltula sp. TS41687]|nr:MAG: hypothetical protein M1816_003347 [Peltula sp. TS41687]
MAEPPSKRKRQPDSKEMWDRDRALAPRGHDRDYRGDGRRDRDRDRRYQSRSRSRDRDRDRDRDRGGRRREASPFRNRSRSRHRERKHGGLRERRGERDQLRGKDRDRSRERDHEPPRGSRYRIRSRSSRHRTRTRSPVRERRPDRRDAARLSVEKSPAAPNGKSNGSGDDMPTDDQVEGDEDDVDAQMKALMDFGGFGTTKQKKVPGNNVYTVRKEKKTEYRQYMSVLGLESANAVLDFAEASLRFQSRVARGPQRQDPSQGTS